MVIGPPRLAGSRLLLAHIPKGETARAFMFAELHVAFAKAGKKTLDGLDPADEGNNPKIGRSAIAELQATGLCCTHG